MQKNRRFNAGKQFRRLPVYSFRFCRKISELLPGKNAGFHLLPLNRFFDSIKVLTICSIFSTIRFCSTRGGRGEEIKLNIRFYTFNRWTSYIMNYLIFKILMSIFTCVYKKGYFHKPGRLPQLTLFRRYDSNHFFQPDDWYCITSLAEWQYLSCQGIPLV